MVDKGNEKMPKSLIKIRDIIDRFISEAEQCANQKLGFAAVLTVFPVILAVSEAVANCTGSLVDSNDENLFLFKQFVPQMSDKTWLISRKSTVNISDDNIAAELNHLRNGLAHGLSQPDYMGLINTRSEVKEFLKENPSVKRVVCVVEFVEATKVTVNSLIQSHPAAILDANPKGSPRTPAKRVILSSGTSSSPASSKS